MQLASLRTDPPKESEMNDVASPERLHPAAAQIVRRSLHDELIERMRALITDGSLAPGQKVPEKALCEQFGVSRTPLREALKVLAHEGLVELIPNRGATVARLTVEDLDEVFPIMGALEALAGELACTNIDDAALAEIERAHVQMIACYAAQDLDGYFSHNQAIHDAITHAAGNPMLAAMQSGLAGRVRRARYLANMSQERWAAAVAEHEEMLAALRKRDGTGLGRVLKRHLENKCATVKEALAARDAETGEART
ncbi:MAG: GntR family transcriptional regulator [Pseudomonadota bacterium]